MIRSRPVVLDTDIGSDVDDLLALVLLAGEPGVDLLAVTTVYGDVALRARLARRTLRLLGRDSVHVHAGETEPLSGRAVWWGGHEGKGVADLQSESFDPGDAADVLVDAARRHPGELVVIAIGPLTNIAAALRRDPAALRGIERLVVMGGEFSGEGPEHNIRSDVAAAREVLAAGIPSVYVGLDVTTRLVFAEADLEVATRSRSALAELLDGQVRGWWHHIGQQWCHPHDPLAVLAHLEPGRFTLRSAAWRVVDQGERLGALIRATDATAVDYAEDVDVEPARLSIRNRLARAITSATPAPSSTTGS